MCQPEPKSFSALQRAEIAEISGNRRPAADNPGFSALQRAEIAEIQFAGSDVGTLRPVSVLFNEPKLLKFFRQVRRDALFHRFQCSSTSRNC